MNSKKPPPRTNISSDSLRVVQAPPTKIVEGESVVVDPVALTKAWAASADVLKEVVQAIRENQEDNERTRLAGVRNRNILFITVGVLIFLNVGSFIWEGNLAHRTENRVKTQVAEQRTLISEAREDSKLTRKVAEDLRNDARALSAAQSKVLELTLAQAQGDSKSAQRTALEAEIMVAATQVQIADTEEGRKKAQKRVRDAVERARELSRELGPVEVNLEAK